MLSFVVAVIAGNRGRSVFGFFLLSMVLSPVISGIILLASPVVEPDDPDEREREEAEWRRSEARKLTEAVAPVAPTVTVSLADELTKLAALRDKGVLTEDEFAGQKRRLLSRL